MTKLLERLDRVPFRRVVWLVPIVLLFHQAEEWNGMEWYDEFFVEQPASALSLRLWLVLVTFDVFFVTWVSTRFRSDATVAFLMLPVAAAAGANGLEHFYWLGAFEAYAPGVIFGGLVGVPLAVYLVRRAVVERLVPVWYAMILGAYALVTLVLAFRAGHAMPPLIRLIHDFSDWAAGIAAAWI